MKQCTAFVLGGGGSRGALQVGALRALLEAGIVPDLLVGTSIGAVNAAGLALWGVTPGGIDALERAWHGISSAQMLDPNTRWLILRSIIGRTSNLTQRKVEGYLESVGMTRSLRFRDIPRIRLALVSADLAAGEPVIFGEDPEESVLEGVLASIALPPWFAPLQKDAHVMVDGGALSNLPIEPAVRMGATEIIALDLDDPPSEFADNLSIMHYIGKYMVAIQSRFACLETALAEARGVPVRRVAFHGLAKDHIWDFSRCRELIPAGYERTKQQIAEWDRMDGAQLAALKMRIELSGDSPQGEPARMNAVNPAVGEAHSIGQNRAGL
jgi:NTE family protein